MKYPVRQQAIQFADIVFTIVATQVIDQPGFIAINILKDRHSGKTGLQVVKADFLVGKEVFA